MVKPLEGDVAAPGNLCPESTHNSAKEWSTLEEMPAEPDVCALTPTAAVLTIASAITRLLNVGTEADAQCQSDATWEGQPGRGGFEDRGRGHMSRNVGPLDAGKTRNDSPLESPGRSTALQTPGFQPSGPDLLSDLQNRKRIKRVVSHHACADLSQQSRGSYAWHPTLYGLRRPCRENRLGQATSLASCWP